mmetsp:Transcript_31668/g.76688  ORF Transcript_31668/g.76688 Transcript_31668/m.76688 type:complete len:489 (+) Transcript_31668:92-1558(+)|eukprot:CAMPEP_0113612154 /NCGR_PEP_ID=MMETSP0017_2-20120614/5947_1 /TAXON_ID=2856 /ORGANISM="Cylindrotheca closterium" /LENGTH=488 /DNA_ID=CAMNT_0000521167 /DNA_START=14 /DNA_END=1480 /DNA_ORIENTATION=+ /assembly_acc=CAM_ASM_000147
MSEAYAISPSASVESQQIIEGIPAGSIQNGESDDTERQSTLFHASVNNETNEMQNSDTFSSHLPLNDDDDDNDDDEFGFSDIVEQALLFGCGLGSSLCYIATLSSLVYFMLLYGPNSYVDLNLAVYLPLLPISFAQAKWDAYYDQVFQSRRTFLFRGLLAFGLSLWGTVGMTSTTSRGLGVVIWNAVLQGTGGAILYGTLNQLASFLGVTDKERRRAKATVSAGVQASALVVLLVTILSGFGQEKSEGFVAFMWIIVAIEAVCFFMFLWLIVKQPRVLASLGRRDSSLELSMHSVGETEGHADEGDGSITEPLLAESNESGNNPNRQLTYVDLWSVTKSCIYVMLATLIPSFLVGSWFTNVKTQWMRLPQILFYTRIAADFAGRLVTIVLPPQGISCLVYGAAFRLIPVFFFFILGEGNDVLFIALVAAIAFLSGYLVTGCFQLAPQCIPEELRAYNLAKQASLLTVAFSVAAVGGLCASFALMKIGF